MPKTNIKLKSSLKSINEKAPPGKRKILPKLKVILADPYKPENEKLSEIEAAELKNLIHSEITKSGLSGREFARKNKISLGLGSSLRAISNKSTSCVLISQTIKPKFIINQIGYFTMEKSSTVPVFLVSNLEAFSEKIFGLKALVLVFPLKLPAKLSEWVSKRTKPKKIVPEVKHRNVTPTTTAKPKLDLEQIYLRRGPNGQRTFIPDVIKSERQKQMADVQKWTEDYISFSKANAIIRKRLVNEHDFEKEKSKVLNALKRMTRVIKEQKIKPSNINKKEKNPAKLPKIIIEESDDDMANLYRSIEMHKIKPNPNRRRKRNKKSEKAFRHL